LGTVSSAWDSNLLRPPGRPIGQPAVAVHDGRTELVVLSGRTVYYSYNHPTHPWGTWTSLGDGNVTAGVSTCLFDTDRLDVFARGPAPGHLVWHTVVSGTIPWGSWESNAGAPPGGLRGSPAALSRTLFKLDLVGQSDMDGRLYHTHYDPDVGWTPWLPLGTFADTIEITPSLSAVDPHRLDLWARGSDGRLFHTSFVGDVPPAAANLAWDTTTIVTSAGLLAPGLGLQVLPGLDQRLDVFVRSATEREIMHLFEAPVVNLK
jgi:hypothetical protein